MLAADASAITITLDSTFIRGCRDGERHLEVRVGNVEPSAGGRQVFGAVAKAETEIAALIRRSLETVGRAADTELTAFTDGCSGLQSILAEAGCQKPPIADWFHIAMRLQHAKQAASGLSTDTPDRMQAKQRSSRKLNACTGGSTGRSDLASAIYLSLHPIRSSNCHWPPDTPTLWTLLAASRWAPAQCLGY
jgi:hypothetical protein